MDAVKFILVKADGEYNNEVDLAGTRIVVNTSIESVANINREAEVVSAPRGTVLQPGDRVIMHHNILRKKNDMRGNEIRSDFYVGLPYDVYFVPPTEVFAYKRGDGDWIAVDPFVFVKPIKKTPVKTKSGIFLDTGKTKYEPNMGHIKYINKELESWGLSPLDKIIFSDNSEYEFEIDGEVLYRMKTADVLARVQ